MVATQGQEGLHVFFHDWVNYWVGSRMPWICPVVYFEADGRSTKKASSDHLNR